MSTQVNVTVGSGGLSEQARQLQTAARQAQLEKERQQRIETQGQEQRTANLAAAGRAPDGSPLFGIGFRQPEVERRPAANRFGANAMLFYFKSTPTVDVNGFGTGPAIIKGRSSAYKFNTSITPNYPANPGDLWVFSPTGGPYNQSYITEPSGPQIGLSQRYVAPGVPAPSVYFVPTSQLRQVSNDYTYELDFKVNLQSFNRIDIRVDRYYNATLNPSEYAGWPFQKCSFSIGKSSPVATNFFLNVNTERTGGGAPSGGTALNQFPMVSDQWNRLAMTITDGNLISVYLNGTLSGTFQLPFSLWTVALSEIDYFSVSYSVVTFDVANLSVSAAKITPKILYSQNYTPAKIT